MKLTITSLELKNAFLFFKLANSALSIKIQVKSSNSLGMKKTGFWTKHYTMTLWPDEKSLKDFSKSGAHLKAMRESGKLAKEIRTLTIDADRFPDWKVAKKLLEDVKPLKF
ncbi:DUF3291 domain-containing protein [Cognataquiflexum rubidum]|uniref:DUF3291 domain-containing protein n=1 Tax=Cognataquiflexum rubidum TaxID=2922273 RepID=UPI001F132677|nr:DUF3291 domain-containing protein [Cognataquiflexum rubidum]MCH6235179.1 DUF3291 domain-containing protein [Cognataquiflexum rubidum]